MTRPDQPIQPASLSSYSIPSILTAYFQTSYSVHVLPTAHQTALSISSFFRLLAASPSSPDVDLEPYLWSSPDALWPTLISYCQGQEERAVQLLVELAQMDGKQDEDRQEEVWGKPFRWRELPLFGAELRERFNGPFQTIFPSTLPVELSSSQLAALTKPHIASYRSLTTLLAHLSVLKHQCLGFLNIAPTYFLWQLRSSLLESPLRFPSPDGPQRMLATLEAEVELEMVVLWLEVAGEGMKALGQVGEGERSLKSGELRVDGKGGLCEERWAFWRRRGREIVDSQDELMTERMKESGRKIRKLVVELMREDSEAG